jgi:peptidyl-prolyl cis-trans isomerase C
MLLTGLVEQLVDQTLLAEQRSTSADADPLVVRMQLENDRRAALAGSVAEERFGGPVDETEVTAAYDAAVAEFEPQPEFNASHILVESEERAKELKTEIDGGGDFAALASENSSDGSAANGGELGWFSLGQMVPEFEGAVQELEVGGVSDPVQSQFGWHLILLNGKRDSATPPLDEMRPALENEVRQTALQAALQEIRATATIEMPEADIPAEAIRNTGLLTD